MPTPLYHYDNQGRYVGKSESLLWMLLKWSPIGWFVWLCLLPILIPYYIVRAILRSNLNPYWKLGLIAGFAGLIVVLANV